MPPVRPLRRRAIPLVEACCDRQLIPLNPHPGQAEFLGLIEQNRVTVGACGRRWGKTRAVAAAALHNLLLVPALDSMVAPGETRYVLVVSNSREQSLILREHALSLVRESPTLSHELESVSEHELRFRNDRALLCLPCSARSVRGYACSFLCYDEMAHFVEEEIGGPRIAAKLWAALTPSVSQFGALGKVVAISTPSGDAGFFAELFAKCSSGELEEAAALQAPSSSNPLLDPSYLELQREALGRDYDREFDAMFVGGAASFLDSDRVRACVQPWRELQPSAGTDWLAAIDPAFVRDPFALSVVGRHPDERERLLVGRTQRWLPVKRGKGHRGRTQASHVEQVIADVAQTVKRFGLTRLISDQHLSGTLVEEFRRHGLRCVVRAWTAESKLAAFRSLRALVDTGRIEMPDDPVLIAEAERLREKQRSGAPTVETPKARDSHCDLIVATAAAVLEHERHGGHGRSRVYSSFRQPGRSLSGRALAVIEPSVGPISDPVADALGMAANAPAERPRFQGSRRAWPLNASGRR